MACTPLGSSCVAAEPPDGACTKAADLGSAIVAATFTAMAEFFCAGAECEGLDAMFTHGPPFVWPGMQRGVMAVWLDRFPQIGSSKSAPIHSATYRAELWIPGYPTVTTNGQAFVVPPAAVRDQVGRMSTILAESWANAICQAMFERECTVWTVGELEPIDSGSGLKGWRLKIEAQVD